MKEKKFEIKSFWVKIWKLLEPSRKRIINLLVLIMVIEIIQLIGPYFLKITIDKITNFKPEELGVILFLVFSIFAIYQIISIVDYFADRKIFAILVEAIEYISNKLPIMIF
jgi:ABC-type bacteriocin/lantibiotic exporter with double-glycine peptidase domain